MVGRVDDRHELVRRGVHVEGYGFGAVDHVAVADDVVPEAGERSRDIEHGLSPHLDVLAEVDGASPEEEGDTVVDSATVAHDQAVPRAVLHVEAHPAAEHDVRRHVRLDDRTAQAGPEDDLAERQRRAKALPEAE